MNNATEKYLIHRLLDELLGVVQIRAEKYTIVYCN